jgi:hypothetical protein
VTDHDPEEDVQLGDLVEAKVSRGRASIIAVRVSADLLARLSEYADVRGLTISEVVRRAAEQITAGGMSAGAVYYTGGELRGPGLIHGSPATGSARTTHAASLKTEKTRALTSSS